MPKRNAPATRQQARRHATRRGLQYLARVACHPRRLHRFGSGLLYCCAFTASTAADPVLRHRARQLALRGHATWKSLWRGVRTPGSPEELTELVHGHLAARRIGLPVHRAIPWLRREAARFSARDFHGWDPRLEPPPASLRDACPCGQVNPPDALRCTHEACQAPLPRLGRHRAFCLALTSAYCGDRLGIPLGCSYADVLRWLPHLPPYPAPSRPGAFHDAVYTVTHIVYTLNDYGRYQLEPAWLPREFRFLARNLEHALGLEDPDMVGEFLDTLRAFGVDENHPAITAAMDYLLEVQNPDGSWGPLENGHDYRRFHTTWAVLDGLRDFNWQGTGISFPELLPSLQRGFATT